MNAEDYQKTRKVLDKASIKHYVKRTQDGLYLVAHHTPMIDHHITRILQDQGWQLHRATENGLEYKHSA